MCKNWLIQVSYPHIKTNIKLHTKWYVITCGNKTKPIVIVGYILQKYKIIKTNIWVRSKTPFKTVPYLRNFDEWNHFPMRLLLIAGNCYQMTHLWDFEEEDELIQFVTLIRYTASTIHDCFYDGNINKITFNCKCCDGFLHQTYNFVEKWGINVVLNDIRAAVNDIERNITYNIMVWSDVEVVSI